MTTNDQRNDTDAAASVPGRSGSVPPAGGADVLLTTVTELDALPVGAVVLGDDGKPWQKMHAGWVTGGRYVAFSPTAGGLLPAIPLAPAPPATRVIVPTPIQDRIDAARAAPLVSAYPYQSTDHDASISAARDDDDPDRVTVEIVVGDRAETRITMWVDEFEQMARAVIGEAGR